MSHWALGAGSRAYGSLVRLLLFARAEYPNMDPRLPKIFDIPGSVLVHPGPAIVALAIVAMGCGGSVRFTDRTPILVTGNLPPPPAVEPEARVELREDRIAINEKIQFAYNDDQILPGSFSLLGEIADVMKKNPQVKLIEIGGHASTEGSDDHNLRLSDRRAKAVMKYLIEKTGIEPQRLTAKGYGEQKPLVAPDESEQQREINRRVEFLILEQDATKREVRIEPTTGEETSQGEPFQPANAEESAR